MKKIKPFTAILTLLPILLMLNACAGFNQESISERRSNINQMRNSTLSELYQLAPSARSHVRGAYGYAVFDNTGVNLFVVSTGTGYGVARNNKSGRDTYMKMFSAGVGVGMGIKNFRGIFVFDNSAVFDQFVNQGWTAQGQADAAAKLENKGLAASMAIEVAPGIHLYQITKTGLALQATIQGTKFYKDDELN